MARQLNLRQIEAFKAVMENGTVSRGAEFLNISQPAMSKLIAYLEADTGLKLFDRKKKNRLAPTEHATLLYDEVGRIFAGVRQVESFVDAIRRADQGRLAVGVMPALSGSFIQQAAAFLKDRRNVFCSIQSLNSNLIVERLVARQFDVGLVSSRIDNPYVKLEPLMEHPLVFIAPLDHPLAAKSHVEPQDLDQVPFVSFNPDTFTGRRIAEMFDRYHVQMQSVMVANVAPMLCEFVAAGFGVSLVHPLMLSGLEHRLVVRPFAPEIPFDFQLCRSADSRNAQLVEAFAQDLRATAAQISRSMLGNS